MAKIRNGFVSNSSSSSFVVAFPKKMKLTKENIKQHLYGNSERIPSPWGSCITDCVDGLSTEDAASQIFKDIEYQLANETAKERRDGIIEVLIHELDLAPEYPSYDHRISNEDSDKQWDAFHAAQKNFRKTVIDKLKELKKEHKVFHFEYSDNDGSFYSLMEHAGVFKNALHWRMSKH